MSQVGYHHFIERKPPTSCACGSRLYRHGKTGRFVKLAGERLRCPSCGKTMTIRNGEVSTIIGRPRKTC